MRIATGMIETAGSDDVGTLMPRGISQETRW
jgi:hypothetical protein